MQPGKQFGLRPTALFELCGDAFGQHARNVFNQAAAGDVGQGFDVVLRQGSQHVFHIQTRGFHQRVFVGHTVKQGRHLALVALHASTAGAFNAASHQRKAIAVNAAGGQAEDHIASFHIRSWQQLRFFSCAHAKARQIVLASGVHTGHFGSFSADQGAARELAALGNAADHGCSCIDIELAAGKIIEEKQGLSALHQDVVDAHGHQINAHGVVHAPFKSQLQLGTHAIGAADQNRLFVALGDFKQRTKTANAAQHAFA